MEAILGVFKSLALWQLGVLAVVLIGAAGGTYGVYVLVSDSGQADLGEDQQFITVQFGDLVNQVSTNGSLIFPERETLTFGSQGTVIEVLVAEGEQVEEGQLLARLDEASVASLEKAVAQARVNLQNAEDALAKAEDPHTPLDLAQAEAKAANARLSLKNAREAVDEIVKGSVEDDPALSNALNNLSQAVEEWDNTAEEARDALTAARQGYQVIFKNWLGITISPEETGQDPNTLLDSWGIDLTSIFDPDQETYESTYGTAPDGPVDDPATLWNEVVVYSWIRLFPGSVSPTCEGEGSSSGGFCVENEFDSAWETYQQARDDLDTVGIQAALAISDAEVAAKSAEGKFDVLRVDVKEKELALAQASLTEAENDLTELLGSIDLLEVALREAEVASAQAALNEAIQQLEGAALTASMTGVISLVSVEVGQEVNPNTPIVVIVDPTIVEVEGIVDEIDVLFVRQGARAQVIMDALPGEVLDGVVSVIGSAAANQQGVVTFPIRILLQVPGGVELREGLSATASIVIREETDVLLVPNQALFGSFSQPIVRMAINGSIKDRPVTLGNSDGFWTVVLAGLREGDQVVMETAQTATDPFAAFRQLREGFGGGVGGGSGFGGGGGFGGGRGQ